MIWDAECVACARTEAGPGATLDLALGAKTGFPGESPLVARFTVERLSDGRFIGTGPFYHGGRFELRPMALLRTGEVRIVVASRKQQAADAAMFRHVGAEPADCSGAGAEELSAFPRGFWRARLANRHRLGA